jgi:hypothetical protein
MKPRTFTIHLLASWSPAWVKVTACWLALALGFFAFETALHSGHRLAEPGKAAECQTLSASKHLTGASVEISDVSAACPATGEAVLFYTEYFQPVFSALVKGRAPPFAQPNLVVRSTTEPNARILVPSARNICPV